MNSRICPNTNDAVASLREAISETLIRRLIRGATSAARNDMRKIKLVFERNSCLISYFDCLAGMERQAAVP